MPPGPPNPEIVWAEDHARQKPRVSPRTLPPGYAEDQAVQLLARLPAVGRPRCYRFGWLTAVLGFGCLGVAVILLVTELDAAFLRTPTLLFAAAGIRQLYLGVMGERR